MKTIILLNENAIIEQVVRDEFINGVLGALEYDPEFPAFKANHREYLGDASRFKEVVKIADRQVRQKIHYTYRLQYLKDVVLARILDDPTFSVLNSLIFFNQVEIVQHVQSNPAFLEELFKIFTTNDVDPRRKKDAVQFIQQCCTIAKGLQAQVRQQLFNNFINAGLFHVITYALKHADASVRVSGTDILINLIDHDSHLMRSQLFKAIHEKQKPLTDTLIELLLVEPDLGVKSQMAEAIKVLLDPVSNSQSVDAMTRNNTDYMTRSRTNAAISQGADQFVQHFYDESVKKLFKPLMSLENRQDMTSLSFSESQLIAHLVEMLCFFIRTHSYRTKFFLISEGMALRVVQLFKCPEKHLQLVALKYFRTCLGMHDPFHYKIMSQHRILEPILDILVQSMPKDNLLNSACLDFFESIRRVSGFFIWTF
jgi:protein phosphatase-4 regulatory subunit 3